MTPTPFHFCPGCGREGLTMAEGKRLSCPTCGFILYLNVAAATAAFITRGPELLFAIRARDPGKGLLDLPGGFIDPGEGAQEGLARELHEELGIHVAAADLAYRFSFPNRYPYKGIEYRTCDLFFQLELPAGLEPVAADDVAGLVWRRPEAVTPEELAFESMRKAVGRFAAESGRP